MKPLQQRFNEKLRITPGCWLWNGARGGGGYAHIRVKGKTIAAHRVSHELHIGPIPVGMHVMHRCDNPICVNPEHLQLGTHLDNMRDMYAKQRRTPAFGLRNGAAKLTPQQVKAIGESRAPSHIVAAQFGVSGARVRQIRRAVARKEN